MSDMKMRIVIGISSFIVTSIIIVLVSYYMCRGI